MDATEYAREVIRELDRTLAAVSPQEAERLADLVLNARRIFIAGAGRSGLAVRAFAMRLMQMGLAAYVVGETVTPA
jgi:6-phospho-3-hexuloisomerase